MKKIISLLFALLMLLSLAACGSGSAGNYAKDASYARTESMTMEAPMAATEAYYGDEDAYYGGFSAAESGKLPENADNSRVDMSPDKIIYSADATVETTEFDKTLEQLQALVAQYDGFVQSSSVNGNNYYNSSRGYSSSRSAYYVVRIPSKYFQPLMGSLSELGNVIRSNTYSDNITAAYYDTEARLTAYQTQEQRLLEMMEKAETVSDLIEIENRLTELRYQIESIQSTLKNWDRQVSYSTVNVNISEVAVYTPEAKMSYGEKLKLAVTNGLQSTGEFFADFLLWFLEALPALLILAVLTVLTVFLIRRGSKKRRAKKAAEQARLAEQARAAREAERKSEE